MDIPQPAKLVRGKTAKGNKEVKTDPITKGPATVQSDVAWNTLVEKVAELMDIRSERVRVDTMSWRLLQKPNAKPLPLQNPAGLEEMIRTLRAMPGAESVLLTVCPPTPGSSGARTAHYVSVLLSA